MSDTDVSAQQETVTEQTAIDAGQGVKVVPLDDETTTEEKSSDTVNAEEKKKRLSEKKSEISQKQWQEMVEKSKGFEEFKVNLAKSLGFDTEEKVEEEDLLKKMEEKVSKLEEESTRKDWEVDHPIVRSDKYREEWAKVNSDTKYASLTYEEKWKLIKKDDTSSTEKEIRSSREGVVPPISRGAQHSGEDIDPEVMAMLRKQFPRMTDEQIRKMSA